MDQLAALRRQHLGDENSIACPAAEAALLPRALEALSEGLMQRRGVRPKR